MNLITHNAIQAHLGERLNADFTSDPEQTWMEEAIHEFGEEGMRYKNSKSLSHLYRYQIWLLHIEGRVKIRMMEMVFDSEEKIAEEKKHYHNRIMDLLARIKEYDKMN